MGFAALFFILAGSLVLMMGYVFNNPESVFKAFNSVTDKILQGQSYEENEEFFLQGIDEITITGRAGDIQVHTYNGSTLKINLSGKVPRFERGPFIAQLAQQSKLNIELHEPLASHWIEMNINGQEYAKEDDSHLKADIYIPVSFKKTLKIETKEGSVHLHLPKNELYELDLQSLTGKIDNTIVQDPVETIDPATVGKIQVLTNQGSITASPQPSEE